MNTARKSGCIDAIASVKTATQLNDLANVFSVWTGVSPKTSRRFQRKYYARLAEFNSATK